jgi:nucleotide-binding universal stress UspA family protein
MIVVGSPKRGPLASAVLGSVVLSLAQRSPVPLLVVPIPDT